MGTQRRHHVLVKVVELPLIGRLCHTVHCNEQPGDYFAHSFSPYSSLSLQLWQYPQISQISQIQQGQICEICGEQKGSERDSLCSWHFCVKFPNWSHLDGAFVRLWQTRSVTLTAHRNHSP